MRFERLEEMLRNEGVGGVQITMHCYGVGAWEVALVGEYLPLAQRRQAVGSTLVGALWSLEEEAGGAQRTAQERNDDGESLLLKIIRAAQAKGSVHFTPRSGTFEGLFSIASLSAQTGNPIQTQFADCHGGTLLEAVMGAASELIRAIDARHRREYLS